jgi:hypothetical protein
MVSAPKAQSMGRWQHRSCVAFRDLKIFADTQTVTAPHLAFGAAQKYE